MDTMQIANKFYDQAVAKGNEQDPSHKWMIAACDLKWNIRQIMDELKTCAPDTYEIIKNKII